MTPLVLFGLAGAAAPVRAQPTITAGPLVAVGATPPPAAPGPPPAADPRHRLVKTEGWFPRLTANASGSLVYNRHVPGIDDGLSVNLGVLVDGAIAWKRHAHQWESTLKLTSTWAKTATQKQPLKSADSLELGSFYSYRFRVLDRRLSAFTGVTLGAALFPGDLVPSKDTDLLLKLKDGSEATDVARKNVRYRLTPAFSPLFLKQLLGLKARPYRHEAARLDLRLSLVGLEAWASGYSVDDDKSTPEKELRQLQDYQQIGVQLEIELSGELKEHLTYGFRAELMFPAHTSVPTPVTGLDLMNTDLAFKLGLKLGKWASLDYVFGARRIPMLLTAWQITSNVVLSVTINI